MMTRLRSPALLNMFAVSFISTRNVDSPRARLSVAPTRQKIASTMPISASAAGTKLPTWAISAMRAVWRRKVDLPAMLGPVSTTRSGPPSASSTLFGTNVPPGEVRLDHGVPPVTDAQHPLVEQAGTGVAVRRGREGQRLAHVQLPQRFAHGEDRPRRLPHLVAHLEEEGALDLHDALGRVVDRAFQVGQACRGVALAADQRLATDEVRRAPGGGSISSPRRSAR